ncbi:hypothetical protein [Stenotrophomonas maltophilia]|uniref:hypothetical protein n=1 Tax=Stenotrophomonas maltophilia TaxID=40324 RepID=UPI0015DFD5B5|nr:hypothetical protein [Stenotrophomonas maltophilia]
MRWKLVRQTVVPGRIYGFKEGVFVVVNEDFTDSWNMVFSKGGAEEKAKQYAAERNANNGLA